MHFPQAIGALWGFWLAVRVGMQHSHTHDRPQCCGGKKQMRDRNRLYRLKYLWFTMVGAEGFEPPTLCSQSRLRVFLSLSANCCNYRRITGFWPPPAAREFCEYLLFSLQTPRNSPRSVSGEGESDRLAAPFGKDRRIVRNGLTGKALHRIERYSRLAL